MDQDREKDPVRDLILRTSREKGVPLADISRAAGRNDAYMHQFIHRGSPKHLPEGIRRVTASMLDLPEDDLRTEPIVPPPPQAKRAGARSAAPEIGSSVAAHRAIVAALPVFNQGDVVELERPREHTPAPPFLVGIQGAFAVWITGPAGRLVPGDMAYVHPNQPPRIGDLVVVLEGERIGLIGGFRGTRHGVAVIAIDPDHNIPDPEQEREAEVDLSTARLLKVVGTWLP